MGMGIKKLFNLSEKLDAALSHLERAVRWGPILMASGIGGVFTWFAAATEQINKYGPLSWWAIGLLAALIVMSIYWLWSAARLYIAKRDFSRIKEIEPSSINVLEDHFARVKINIQDFTNPFFEWNDNKSFAHCKIYGPATIFVVGGIFSNSHFIECEAILIKDDAKIKNAIGFRNLNITDCKLYNITLLVPEAMREGFEKGVPGMRWLNA